MHLLELRCLQFLYLITLMAIVSRLLISLLDYENHIAIDVVQLFILSHHVSIVLIRRGWPSILDCFGKIAEIVLIWIFGLRPVVYLRDRGNLVAPIDAGPSIFGFIILWATETLLLFVLLIFQIVKMVQLKSLRCWTTRNGSKQQLSRGEIIFGPAWRASLSVEHWLIKAFRALLITSLLVFLPLFAYYSIVWQPFLTGSNGPSNVRYLEDLPDSELVVVPGSSPMNIMVYMVPPGPYSAAIAAVPDDSINASTISYTDDSFDAPEFHNCTSFARIILPIFGSPTGFLATCFPSVDVSFSGPGPSTNILVALNFTKLGLFRGTPVSSPGVAVPVSVVAGWGDVEDIIQYTSPISITTGSRLIGGMRILGRQILPASPWCALGIPTAYRELPIIEFSTAGPDPNPWTTQAEDIGSLRLYFDIDYSKPRIVQEYTDRSLLGGVASVGGLWSFANGVAALLFGGGILYHAFGTKPFSILGCMHFFQRKKLRKALHAEYPNIQREGGRPGSETAGLVAFIRQHFMDIDLERAETENAETIGTVVAANAPDTNPELSLTSERNQIPPTSLISVADDATRPINSGIASSEKPFVTSSISSG